MAHSWTRWCAGSSAVFFRGDQEKYGLLPIVVEDVGVFGVGACDVVRVWVFEVGDFTVTAIGGTAEPARHDRAVEKIEELFAGTTFLGEG